MSSAAPAFGLAEPHPQLARLGMWVFLASEVLFFGAIVVAYAVARSHAPAGFAAASGHTNLWLGTLNTALLLTSSALVAVAAQAITADWWAEYLCCIRGTALLGVAFLVVKGVEYHAEWVEGLFPGPGFALAVPGAQLFFAWYFTATSLHAVHLAVGIGWCLLLGSGAVQPTPSRVHGVALYWHFVDVVWIVLYPLIYLVAPRS